MQPVYFKSATYAEQELKPAVFELMDKCGGGKITAGSRVLIKPNFLRLAKPESAILTHPGIVVAAWRFVPTERWQPKCRKPAWYLISLV